MSKSKKNILVKSLLVRNLKRYLVGLLCEKVLTDHKPLIPLLMKRDLADTPVWCQRMLMRLMRLNIVAEFIPGKDLIVADALPSSPGTDDSSQYEKGLKADISMYVDTVRDSWSISDAKLDKLRKVTAEDITLSIVLEYTRSG